MSLTAITTLGSINPIGYDYQININIDIIILIIKSGEK